ncbi:MAG: hypothetical protein IKS75_08015 [Clostridiales bacterium]|nr:hypothetical protein [Clostridiales bacterium]
MSADKSGKTAAILCLIANVLSVIAIVGTPVLFAMGIMAGVSPGEGSASLSGFWITAVLALLGIIAALVLSIVSLVLHRKNVWAIINIVYISIVILAGILITAGIVSTFYLYVEDHHADDGHIIDNYNVENSECPYYDKLMDCLDSHSFDSVKTRVATRAIDGKTGNYFYVLDVYISSNASDEEIEEFNAFLVEFRDICIWQDKLEPERDNMRVMINIYYYDPDDDSGIMYYGTCRLSSESSDSELDVRDYIDLAIKENTAKHQDIPENPSGDCLIVLE